MKLSKAMYFCAVLLVFLSGCYTLQPPEGIFRSHSETVNRRYLQTRVYEKEDESEILAACAGVLQDLGFTLDETERELGLIVGSKERSAMNTGVMAGALALDIAMAALSGAGGGGYSGSSFYKMVDNVQKIRGAVVTKKSESGANLVVRVTFQRLVWNVGGQISKVETLDEPEMYQGFFEKLSKAIFLEAESI